MFDKIYDVVFMIPKGRVATYGQVAKAVGAPCDARRVGWALASLGQRREELPVPWQRVVAAGGKISLPGTRQRMLLEEEGIAFDHRDRIDLEVYGWKGFDRIVDAYPGTGVRKRGKPENPRSGHSLEKSGRASQGDMQSS